MKKSSNFKYLISAVFVCFGSAYLGRKTEEKDAKRQFVKGNKSKFWTRLEPLLTV